MLTKEDTGNFSERKFMVPCCLGLNLETNYAHLFPLDPLPLQLFPRDTMRLDPRRRRPFYFYTNHSVLPTLSKHLIAKNKRLLPLLPISCSKVTNLSRIRLTHFPCLPKVDTTKTHFSKLLSSLQEKFRLIVQNESNFARFCKCSRFHQHPALLVSVSPTLKITIFLTILELSNGLGITVKVGYQLSSNRGIKQLQLATLISAAANADRVTLFRGLQFQNFSPQMPTRCTGSRPL